MTALPGATRIRAGRSAAEGFDVIVIGAGVAGLSAAETLAAHGARVLILEARNRIGGRIHAVAAPGWELPVPLGAEFVHGPDPELEELCDRAALTREPVEEIHWRAENGRLIPVPDFWERVDAALQGIGPAFAGSFADWLHQEAPQLSATTRRDLRHFVSGFHAAELERMSAATLYRAAQSEEEQSRLESGFGALVQAIAARLPADRVTIKLSSPVSRISWKPHAVTVISGAAASQWRAPAVIVTVPLGVLQQDGQSRGGITFEPMLDDRLGLWRQLGVGHVQRIVMRFDPSFWADPVVPAALREEQGKRFGFIHSDESPFPVWWALAPHPILVGWWGGPEAKVASTWTAAELRARALRTLSRLIGVTVEQLDRRLVDWRHHDWTADIYAQGAYSFATAGLEAAARQSGEPVADTLFFAGEAFADPESLGTVQAARKSGRSVAESVVQSLRSTRGRAIR